eukprot:TRINITY_DN14492_c0_g1_i1.p1 TRINITY_DN14492_c0_g1~~TRINITY_DN14492_c0_g1_i1.p1  ORF type:complete len:487 (+),score=111.54 TRINITY_DN14492_c0_g1_i1:97-1557(+)
MTEIETSASSTMTSVLLKDEYKTLNLGKVIYLSVLACVFLSAYFPVQGLYGTILGSIGLAELSATFFVFTYLSGMIGTALAPYILTKFKPAFSKMFPVSVLAYLFVYIPCLIAWRCKDQTEPSGTCSKPFLVGLFITSGSFVGLGQGNFWVTQRVYMESASSIYNSGKYWGIFWSIVQASFVVGNFLLMITGGVSYLVILLLALMAITCLTSLAFTLMRNPEPYPADTPIVNSANAKTPAGRRASRVMAKIEPEELAKEPQNVVSPIAVVCYMLRWESLKYAPFFLVSGIHAGFLYSKVPTLAGETVFPSNDVEYVSSKIGMMLICQGLAEIAGGFFIGYVYDELSKKGAIILTICMDAIYIGLSIFAYTERSYTMFFAVITFGGFVDCCNMALTGSVFSILYEDKFEAHATYSLFFNLSCAISSGMGFMDNPMPYYGVFGVMLVLTVISLYKRILSAQSSLLAFDKTLICVFSEFISYMSGYQIW